MNPIIFQVGQFSVRWYSVLILIGVLCGYEIAKREGKRLNFSEDFIFNMMFWTVIFGLIGARIYYVIFNWSIYSSDLLSIFKLWEGGLAIHGGIIAGLIALYFYCNKYNVKVIRMTDIIVVSLILAQAIGRWGNFFNSEAHGAATTLRALEANPFLPEFIIKGMNIGGVYYQPTFYYESVFCLVGFIIMLILRRNKNLKVSQLTAFYLIWYGLVRFVIESMRTDSLMLGAFKMAQIVSILMIIIGIVMIIISLKKKKYDNLYNIKEKKMI